MTATFEFERLLESVLDADGPQTVPPTVVEAALTQSRALKQRRSRVPVLDRQAWPAWGRSVPSGSRTIPSPLMRVMLMALIATALIALGVIGSALLREDPTPMELQSTFFRHFEYAIPLDSDMRISGAIPEMVAWVGGPDRWNGALDTADDSSQPHSHQARGVVIGRGTEAWSHKAGGRFMLRTAPAEFLADLRDEANTRMGPVEPTTLDGWAALAATLQGTGGQDIHSGGSRGPFVQLIVPSRLIVSEVDGTTIFIVIWARTADDLRAWMPIADEFVDSIHFVPD